MVYLFGSELPKNQFVFLSLTFIYGIGKSTAIQVCRNLGFSNQLKIKDLSKEQTKKLMKAVSQLPMQLATDLKKTKTLSKKRLVSIKSYKGFRAQRGLPLRGQRTHTNAKTARKRFI